MSTNIETPQYFNDITWDDASSLRWQRLSQTYWRRTEDIIRYLIKDIDGTYTIEDGSKVKIDETLTEDVFRDRGMSDLPLGEYLQQFTHPKLIYWQSLNTRHLPSIRANVNAIPYPQQIYSRLISTLDPSIIGLHNVECSVGGNPLFSISFDGGNYQHWNGDNWIDSGDDSGMSATTFESITSDIWYEQIKNKPTMRVRIILNSLTDLFYKLTFYFENN